MPKKPFNPFWAKFILGVLLFCGYFAAGAYLALIKGYIPYDALARLVSAHLVFHGTEVKLASIGFVWPPIPTLLLLPFTLVPYLVQTWLAVVVVSAFFMALASLLVGEIAAIFDLPGGWRLLLILLFAANPLMIVFGANGMSEAILIAAILAGCYWLLRFWRTDRNLDLIMAAGFFSLLPLIRYEAALLSAGTGALILVHTWSQGHRRLPLEPFRQFVEGRLLAYSALAIYPIFLWAVASWQIMGSPLYFLVNDRSALSLASMQLSGYRSLSLDLFSAFRITFGVWVAAFALGTIAALAAILLGLRRRQPFLVGFGLFPFLLPLMQGVLLSWNTNVPLLRYFILTVPLGAVVALAAWSAAGPWLDSAPKRNLAMAGIALLFLASNYGSLVVLKNYEFQNIERSTWQALTTRETISNQDVEDALAVGRLLPAIIPAGSRVLVDTYQFGFAVMLGANNPRLFLDFTDPHYDQAVLNPSAYVDYVLVPKTEGRGAFYSVNRAHPNLHDKGAPWAELLDVLPDTGLEWRLYKVIR